jgi:hypothetical protein
MGPDTTRGEFGVDAEAQERVAQCGVCGDDRGGARGELGCQCAVVRDGAVQGGGGVGDEGRDVLGFEVQLRSLFGGDKFSLHLVSGRRDDPVFDNTQGGGR